MTIGIITIHTGYNEGAVLQSLALSRLLAEVTGEAVEVLDHRYAKGLVKTEGPADTARKQAIVRFRDTRLPLSPERFEDDHKAAWAYAAGRYRAVVVGSDEIWKVVYRRRLGGLLAVQDDPLAPAYPNVWWPDASAGPVRVAYAATAGTRTDWTAIPGRARRQMAAAVQGFRAIGLRDGRTRAFLDAIAPAAAARSVRVPDPTLAFDVLPEADPRIRDRLAALGVDFSRRRVAFVTGASPKLDGLAAALRADGAQVSAISRPVAGTELDLSGAPFDPLDWAAALGTFDLVVTDRMHGIIFSLRGGVPVLMLDTRRRTMGLATKNEELAERFGVLSSYAVLHEPAVTAESLAAQARGLLSGGWPVEAVRERIAAERDIAFGFLRNALAA